MVEEGGQEKFYFYKKGGGGYSHAEGEGTTSFGVVLKWECKVLAILIGGGVQNVSILLKGGHEQIYPVLGYHKKFWTRDFLFV